MKALLVALLLLPTFANAKSKPDTFYVYADKADHRNHYIPSGWMGDYGDIKFNDSYKQNCKEGATCIQIIYNAKGAQGANWAGIFWQHPANNWGDKGKDQGYDLSGYKRLTFWARGEKGDETIVEFGMGGITGNDPDSANARIGPIHLTKEWTQYTVDLKDQDLKYVIGGFVYSTNKDYNPNGFTMYLDEIRYER